MPLDSFAFIPDLPLTVFHQNNLYQLTLDGVLEHYPLFDPVTHTPLKTLNKAAYDDCIGVHLPYMASKMGIKSLRGMDVLELFAFVHPTRFCVPTIQGLIKACGLPPFHLEHEDPSELPLKLLDIIQILLNDFVQKEDHLSLLPIAAAMNGQTMNQWGWTRYLYAAAQIDYTLETSLAPTRKSLSVWRTLEEWTEDAPKDSAHHYPISPEETTAQLESILHRKQSTPRTEQQNFAHHIGQIFTPADHPDQPPALILAEAQTGTGKTIGYLAPASAYTEKNGNTVWISTYTRNLQRQLEQELEHLYPDPVIHRKNVAVRKGRENYLCLLNFEDHVNAAATSAHPRALVAAGLMARWIMCTPDGDLSGRSFSGWWAGLLGHGATYGLNDQRGECIYSACDHYQKCFVEKSQRKTRHASLVIANHAVVMNQVAMAANMAQSETEDSAHKIPAHYIFDEGHHLFDAADSAFAIHFTIRETRDLRRWILGYEQMNSKRSRQKGLQKRLEDLIAQDEPAKKQLDRIVRAAYALPNEGWAERIPTNPNGVFESCFAFAFYQITARATANDESEQFYSTEIHPHPLAETLSEWMQNCIAALFELTHPMEKLSQLLDERLVKEAEFLAKDDRNRINALARSLEKRSKYMIRAWIDLLQDILAATTEPSKRTTKFTDWMEITRIEGGIFDIGFFRHWIDPLEPFATAIKPYLKGMAITSATLRDESDWQSALPYLGTEFLNPTPSLSQHKSPFDYAKQTRIYIITDIPKQDQKQVAAAFQALFSISKGGAIGFFTAIQRLKSVYRQINDPLAVLHIPLYAQHIDQMDTGTLIDIFREDENACLLGTDALRDGVDVPGQSLRMIVFDRIPWPRPTLLHKDRRAHYGQSSYNDRITRMKLKQAYGRLIRKEDDYGVFVLMDSAVPSRLFNAFPENVSIIKTDLSNALIQIAEFFKAMQ